MRRFIALSLALVMAAACAAPRPQEPARSSATMTPVAPKRALAAKRPPRPAIPPAVLALLLAGDEGAAPAPLDPAVAQRSAELAAPTPPATLCATWLPTSKRYHQVGKYTWLRNDFSRALAWVLTSFYWDAPHPVGTARELVVSDLCGLTPDVEPDHPAPAHGNGLRWADVHYPTLGPTNLTQAAYALPKDLPYTSIWQARPTPVMLDPARTWWLWDRLVKVFPGIGISTDKHILEAVRTWTVEHHADPACLARVHGDDPGRWQHDQHMHLDLGDQVAWIAFY